jgi:hypothetical protein
MGVCAALGLPQRHLADARSRAANWSLMARRCCWLGAPAARISTRNARVASG